MNFLYIIYGEREEFHAQAKLSILSLQRFLTKEDRVYVLTDSPKPYALFRDHIEWHVLPTAQFTEWFGAKRFFFRSKTLGLSYMMKKIGGDFCYLDTDTLAVKNIDALKTHIQSGGRAMFDCERQLGRARDPLSRDYWSHIGGRSFAGFLVPENLYMWNAGLVALSQKDLPLLDDVVKITDEFLQLPKEHIAFDEQIAQGMVFQLQGEIYEARKEILHYWGNKTNWNRAVFAFTEEYLGDGANLETATRALDKFPVHTPLRIHSPFWPKLKNSFRKRWQKCRQLLSAAD